MPLMILDRDPFWKDKLTRCERDLRRQRERVVALETENAMLHLKVTRLLAEITRTRTPVHPYRDDLYRQKLANLRHQMQVMQGGQRDLSAAMSSWVWDIGQMTSQIEQAFSRLSEKWTEDTRQLKHEKDHIMQRYEQERVRRRLIHNSLVELRGNIRVYCRVRPLVPLDRAHMRHQQSESAHGPEALIVQAVDNERVIVSSDKHQKEFEFDRVYKPSESQSAVFEDVKPLLTSLLDGYNVCIMAYGQTGSGKTHTMLRPAHAQDDEQQEGEPQGLREETLKETIGEGSAEDGLIPRAVREVFRLLRERGAAQEVDISVAEIYNNNLRDLLIPGNSSNTTLTSRRVTSVRGVLDLVWAGLVSRSRGVTAIHRHSSRSHLVVTLSLALLTARGTSNNVGMKSRSPSPGHLSPRSPHRPQNATWAGGPQDSGALMWEQVESKLQLVDLAGSESVAMSETCGAAFMETSHINRSLSALADTLTAVDEGRDHVPYRNSRLTHYLQDAIGGDSKLLIMLCASPTKRFQTETLHCLAFGQRVRQVQRAASSRKHQRARRTKSASQVSLKGAQLWPTQSRVPSPRYRSTSKSQ